MKRYILFLCFFSLQIVIFGQSKITNADDFTAAAYRGKDLVSELAKNIHRPDDTFTKEMEGDVILRVRIDKYGKLQDPVCNYAATIDLGKSAVDAIRQLDHDWHPTLRGDMAISKSYLIVFRYRLTEKKSTAHPLATINKKIKKEKYEQALALLDAAIADNDFDAHNFLKRSEVFDLLNLKEKAEADLVHAAKLQSAVLAIVDFELIIEKNLGNAGTIVLQAIPREAIRVMPRNH